MTARIRIARETDLPVINAIFNHYVARSTCTWAAERVAPDERIEWFRDHDEDHPIVVAEIEGEVVGWGSLSVVRPGAGYRYTVENSVYVHPDRRRQGIGRTLLEDLIRRATQIGYHSIIAYVSGDQQASIALHERFGFVRVGHVPEVGRKFDAWLDLVMMQRRLG